MQKSGSVKGKLLLLFIAVAWGSSMVVIKGSTDFIPPGMLLALRFTIASIILAIIYRKQLKLIDKDYIKAGLFIGVCLFGAYFTQTIGVMLEMPGKSHFLSSAYCVFVPFIGWLVLRERPKLYHIVAATMCAIGIIFVSVAGTFSISFGDSISILSSLFWAAQIIAIAKWGKDKDAVHSVGDPGMDIYAHSGDGGQRTDQRRGCIWSSISRYCLLRIVLPVPDHLPEDRVAYKRIYHPQLREHLRNHLRNGVLQRADDSEQGYRICTDVRSYPDRGAAA